MTLSFSDFQPDKPRLALIASLIAALTIPAIGYLIWSATQHDTRGETFAAVLVGVSFFFSSGLGLFITPHGRPREGVWFTRLVGLSMILWGSVLLSYEFPGPFGPFIIPLVVIAAGTQFLFPVLAAFIVIRQRRQSKNYEKSGPSN